MIYQEQTTTDTEDYPQPTYFSIYIVIVGTIIMEFDGSIVVVVMVGWDCVHAVN